MLPFDHDLEDACRPLSRIQKVHPR